MSTSNDLPQRPTELGEIKRPLTPASIAADLEGRKEEKYLSDPALNAAKGVSTLDPVGLSHYHYERFTSFLKDQLIKFERENRRLRDTDLAKWFHLLGGFFMAGGVIGARWYPEYKALELAGFISGAFVQVLALALPWLKAKYSN
ncbi:MAG: hypothetical protein AABZ47_14915 [Planctomycetota bacterium]